MLRRLRLDFWLVAATMLLASHPAAAAESAQVSEASTFSLFALGVLGVIAGRLLSTRRSDSDD